MTQEKEIKIKLLKLSLNQFVKMITKKGFKKEKEIQQLDIYFDTKDWYLYENLAALRLRIVDGKDYSFSFKKMFYRPQNKDHYFIEEIETKFPFDDTTKFKEIFGILSINYIGRKFRSGQEISDYLKKHNYFDEQKMPKNRQIYVCGEDEITIDNVDKVGIIIELECKENEPLEVIKTILDNSEWERSLEGTSYIWLKNIKGLTSHTKNLERFKTDPTWNVWKTDNFSS